MNQLQQNIVNFLVQYGFQIIGAIITLVVGFFLARWTGDMLRRWLEKGQLEPPIRVLFVRIARLFVMAVVLLLVLPKFGIQITPLIAGLSVAGVGVGLATQGVLGNLVAGLVIIFTKPFRVGEYIELLGVNGRVANIELFSTILLHPDHSRVIIPNRKIVGEILHNYGTVRQLDLIVRVAYEAELESTLQIISQVLKENSKVLREPAPVFGVTTLADSSIEIAIKPWVLVDDYGAARAEIYQSVISKFRERGILIPFPQRVIRMLSEGALGDRQVSS